MTPQVFHENGKNTLDRHNTIDQLGREQWLSSIIGMGALTKKDTFEVLLRRSRVQGSAGPSSSSSAAASCNVPLTIILPAESAALEDLWETVCYIAKPALGSAGNNIELLTGRSAVRRWWHSYLSLTKLQEQDIGACFAEELRCKCTSDRPV